MSTSSIIDRIDALLTRTQPFDRLAEEERKEILADISIAYYQEGDVILEQRSTAHAGLYIVESGLVRLLDVDQQRLIDKCGEGDVFGSFGLLKGGLLIYEAKAVEPTVCVVLKGARFQQLYEKNEDFRAYFDQDLKQYLSRIGERLDVAGAHLLMTRRLRQLNHRDVITIEPEATALEAARLMRSESIGSLVVVQEGKMMGILTDRDLRAKLIAVGKPYETPIRRLMTSPVQTISEEATVLDALLQMLRNEIYRLVIVSEGKGAPRPVGLLTDRDLAHFRGQDPVATLRRVSHAPVASELSRIRTETGEHLLNLYRQGVPPERLNAIISILYDRLLRRVLELTERELRSGAGRVNLQWAWLRLGNGGRQETALSSEKYGALVYDNPQDDDQAERAEQWFGRLFEHANATLEACGFRTSDDAAPDLPRCLSLRQWKKTYRTWIFQADVDDLAAVPPFFDLRCVHGERSLFDALRLDVEDALNVQVMDTERNFLGMLAARALEYRPPLSFFGRFVLDRSGEERPSFNIEERGVRPIVDAARILGLELRYVVSTSTYDRLRRAAESIPDIAEPVGKALEAYQLLVDIRLAHQLRAVEADEEPTNQIQPASLTKVQRNLLRAAFSAVSDLQDVLAKRYNVQRRSFF